MFSKGNSLNNVKIMVDAEIYTYEEYYKFEKVLFEMIRPALNLSPFEKYLYAYNIETVLAEKVETILSRLEANGRLKDFYDIYLIYTKEWKFWCK